MPKRYCVGRAITVRDEPVRIYSAGGKRGMIEQITDYVVEEVFNDLGGFLAAHPHLYVSINLSAADFLSSRLIVMIHEKRVSIQCLRNR